MKKAAVAVTVTRRADQEIQSLRMGRLYVLNRTPMRRKILILHYQVLFVTLIQVIILRTIINRLLIVGFIVNSGEEEVIVDNDGDDEADDIGLKRKRKRLVRNKLAGKF